MITLAAAVVLAALTLISVVLIGRAFLDQARSDLTVVLAEPLTERDQDAP